MSRAILDTDVGLFNEASYAWLVCLSAGLFFFYSFFQLNIFDVMNRPLSLDFNLDASQISWMSSSYLWANLLFLLPAGLVLDRFSTRKVILNTLLLSIGGTLGFALSHSFLVACFFHFITGIANAFCFLACVILVANWFSSERQALVIGSLVTMAFMGGMAAHTPFACLTESYGWRYALFIDGLIGLMFFLWIFLFVQDRPKGLGFIPAKVSKKEQLLLLKQALANRQNWLAGLYAGLLNLPIMILCALWGASYLKVVHHLADLTAFNVVSLIFIGSMLGCPFLGYLSDKQGLRKPIMLIGAVFSLLTLLPLFMGLVLSEWQLSGLFFSLGFFTSTQVIAYPLITESNKGHNIGAATGIASLLIMGLAAVGQVFFGYLMRFYQDYGHAYTALDFYLALWIFPLAAILAFVATLAIKETYCKALDKRS